VSGHVPEFDPFVLDTVTQFPVDLSGDGLGKKVRNADKRGITENGNPGIRW